MAVTALFVTPVRSVQADGVISIGELTVHFIDVGQGDACVVELPDDRTMLIDAGENKTSVKNKLNEYITQNITDDEGNTIEYFDFAILTHSDSDHIGSMAYVLGLFPAKTIYRPNEECKYSGCSGDPACSGSEARNSFWGDEHGEKSTKTYHNALQAAYACADEVIVVNPYDDTQNVITSTSDEEYSINFYSPLSPKYSDHNNYSPIIVINYRGKNVVLSGDAEQNNETEFVTAANSGEGRYAVFKDFSADVIKLGHHGSRTSSSEDYLNVMTKSSLRSGVFVIISCGAGNSYGHPHEEVLTRLSLLGFTSDNVLRTDVVSDIVISITQADGEYKVVYGDRTGGSSGNESSGGSSENENSGNESANANGEQTSEAIDVLELWKGLELYVKVIIIAVVVTLVIIVLAAGSKKSKRKTKTKRGKRR